MMESRRLLWIFGPLAGLCWACWIYLLFFFNVGAIANFGDPWRIIFYVLLVLAPAVTFVPLSLWLRWHFYGPYAVLGWAVFGYLMAFAPVPAALDREIKVGPASPATLLQGWYWFVVLFVVCTTVLAPLAHLVGLRFLTSRTHQRDLLRSWREAGLLSFYFVEVAAVRSLGQLTWPIALLSLLLLVLVEALFLARKA
jgi:hypothetical protein